MCREAQAYIDYKMMEPRMAIVLYMNGSKEAVLEKFDIDSSTGNLVNPARLTEENTRELSNALVTDGVQGMMSGTMPPYTLRVTRTSIAFGIPRGKRTLLLDTNDGKPKKQDVWMPDMVLSYRWTSFHNLDVFWTRSLEKAMAEPYVQHLWPAPTPNTDEVGNVCLGNTMDKVKFGISAFKMASDVIRCFMHGTFNEWRSEETIAMMKVMTAAAKNPKIASNFWRHPSTLEWQNARKPVSVDNLGKPSM